MGHQLRAGLGIRIRIKAVQLLILPEGVVREILVLIHLVRGDVQNGADATATAVILPHALQKIHCAHDIALIGFPGMHIALPHNGLRRQMQHKRRLRFLIKALQMLKIADVTDLRTHISGKLQHGKQIRLRGRCQGIAVDLRAQQLQYQ